MNESETGVYENGRLVFSILLYLGELYCENLDLVQNSSGNIRGEVYGAELIDVSMSGSGRMVIAGDTDELATSHNSSGRVDFLDVEAVDVTVRSSGSGDTYTTCMGILDVTILGSGDVIYAGNPTDISYKITGSGNLRPY